MSASDLNRDLRSEDDLKGEQRAIGLRVIVGGCEPYRGRESSFVREFRANVGDALINAMNGVFLSALERGSPQFGPERVHRAAQLLRFGWRHAFDINRADFREFFQVACESQVHNHVRLIPAGLRCDGSEKISVGLEKMLQCFLALRRQIIGKCGLWGDNRRLQQARVWKGLNGDGKG